MTTKNPSPPLHPQTHSRHGDAAPEQRAPDPSRETRRGEPAAPIVIIKLEGAPALSIEIEPVASAEPKSEQIQGDHVAGRDCRHDGDRRTGDFVGTMVSFRTSDLQLIAIQQLHPTQMTVGHREVIERRQLWRVASAAGGGTARRLTVPVVLGPGARGYILDRHHQLCALAAEGVADVHVAIVDDLRRLELTAFWRTLDWRGWCRPRDTEGQRQKYSDIPTTINGLADDPFRSLSRALRRAGGYSKQKTPFADFFWADFLRERISRTLVIDDFETAVKEALTLSSKGGPLSGLNYDTRIDLLPKILEI